MKIIIDIPDICYENTKRLGTLSTINDYELTSAILDGIVLPKNHGKLIDADEFAKKIMHDNTIEDVGDVFDAIVNSTTILDAEVSE